MLPAHYNPKMSSPPGPWLEDVTGSSMAKCDNLSPHYNVMTSVSPSASSLNVSQQNWDRQFQLYFNGIYYLKMYNLSFLESAEYLPIYKFCIIKVIKFLELHISKHSFS